MGVDLVPSSQQFFVPVRRLGVELANDFTALLLQQLNLLADLRVSYAGQLQLAAFANFDQPHLLQPITLSLDLLYLSVVGQVAFDGAAPWRLCKRTA